MVQYGKISGTSDKSKGYTFYEYITADGAAYIDTGFIPNRDTRVVVEGVNVGTDLCALFGARLSSNTDCFNVWVSGRNAYVQYNDGAYTTNTFSNAFDTDYHFLIDVNKNNIKVNSQEKTVSFDSFNAGSTLTIFTVNTNGVVDTRMSKAKIISFKIYDNGTLRRDLVPATNSEGIAGMYDKVNGTFYTGRGNGHISLSSNKSETDGLFDIQNVKVFKEGSVKTWNGEGGTWNSYQYQTSWVGVSVTNLDVFSEVTSLRQCSYNNYTGFHRNLATTDSTNVQFWIDARRIYICYNPTSVNMPTGWKNEDGTPNVENIKTIVTGWLKEKPFMFLLDKEGVNYTSKEKLFEDYFVEVDRIVKYGKYNVFDPYEREYANCLDFRVSGTGPTAVFNEPDYSKIYWTFASNGHHGYGSTTDFEAHNHYRDDSWYFYMKDGKLYEGNNSTETHNWYWPAFPLKLEKGKTYTFSVNCERIKQSTGISSCDIVVVSYNSDGVWDKQMSPNAMTTNGDIISVTFTVPDTFAWGLAFIRCAYPGNEVEFSEIQICEGTEVKPYEKAKNLLWENHLLMTDESEYTYITFDDESTIKLK